ncbi:hypothetical protein Ddye_010093 [Dipteronia dyeriana]|uniref:Uncharacterized protein n=1 Tax=Dipteronia dyeriana TaxID=168575 RepID=A0AAE0CMY5_9ROSI|nr:hypothetical protein Ddye_010093 [Dipteronia dyeriana]
MRINVKQVIGEEVGVDRGVIVFSSSMTNIPLMEIVEEKMMEMMGIVGMRQEVGILVQEVGMLVQQVGMFVPEVGMLVQQVVMLVRQVRMLMQLELGGSRSPSPVARRPSPPFVPRRRSSLVPVLDRRRPVVARPRPQPRRLSSSSQSPSPSPSPVGIAGRRRLPSPIADLRCPALHFFTSSSAKVSL